MLPIRYLTLITTAIAVAAAWFAMPHAVSAGGSCHEGNGVSESAGTTVTMTNNCFVATVLRVDEGATVTFLNKDEAAHSVTGVAWTWGDDTPLGEGQSVQHVFDENGVYVYTCLLHPGMAGAIVVGDGSGPGPSAAAAVRDGGPRSASGAGVTGAQPDTSSPAANTPASDDGGASAAIIIGAVAAGVALLLAVAGGSLALARASASRRAAAR